MRISFRSRLLLLFISLAGGVLLATLVAVSLATNKQAELTVERELAVSERVLGELLKRRGEQLEQAAQVLADDFGFREAVASGDQATLVSAMVNHGDRIGTQLMALYGVNGQELASTHQLSAGTDFSTLRGVRLIDGELFQLVTVPVRAPDVIAYATLGFVIDDQLADALKQLTNTDLTFFDSQGQQVLASSLAQPLQQELLAVAAQQNLNEWLVENELAGHLSTFNAVELLVSTSRSDATQAFQTLRTQYLGFGLATLLVALVLAIATARYFNQPLARLTQAAEALRRGRYDAPLKLQRQDEFGQLGATFDTMREAIAEREQRIVYQLEHDLLTGLPNRESFYKNLNERLKQQQNGVMLILNIMRFRALNDRLGQSFGDQVLQHVANRLKEVFATDCFVARLASDEFVVLCSHTGENAEEANFAANLEALQRTPWHVGEASYRLEFRAGTVRFPDYGAEVDVLLRRAQLAAQLARSEKQLLATYQQGSDESYLRRLQILQALPDAITNRKLQLHYQPKMDCASGRVIGAEALIRWQHEQLGVIRPDEFIPLAEQSGDILRVTRWVCQAALDQQQYWLEQGIDVQMSVNLSALDLQADDLVDFIANELQERHLVAKKLTLEVTESAVMADLEQAQQRLQELRQLGCKIALDDYGTGYASLAQLKHLPLDKLKLDQSFIRGLDTNESDRIIVQSTLTLAHQLALQTVAEGVEEKSAWQILQSMGCDTLQGYYFSRPMAAAEFEQWLLNEASKFQVESKVSSN
ncbi:putative bifunctional diguanylate cyclase/phosphodiesterase [Pseudidiomarina homiensis]|uniref:putative bifunctional diguanylate cyclase/phosphodiesterase n=1 Tax=Pseudidiomarina homiensis TaxID=364198 RepID=UPI00215AC802|nr:EAL domain-containing protein [Pseudidiomarina homiensis]